MYLIKLSNNYSQFFNFEYESIKYNVHILYNYRASSWSMSIGNEDIKKNGIGMLIGTDLLKSYGFDFALYMININNNYEDAGVKNLSSDFRLLLLSNDEINE